MTDSSGDRNPVEQLSSPSTGLPMDTVSLVEATAANSGCGTP